MESVNIDDSFNDDDFVDIDDHSENGNDGSLGEIEELKAENLGLRERIQKYETELMQLVEPVSYTHLTLPTILLV